MFYPAGEEPTSDDFDSEDEYGTLTEDHGEPKNQKYQLFSWSAQTTTTEHKPGKCIKSPSVKQRIKMAVQTSMDSEDFRMAVLKGNTELVKQWLTSGHDVETPLKGGWTALMYACDNGNTEMIDLLLGCGANPNSNKDSFTALMCLCACKNLNHDEKLGVSAKLLIDKGARVDARDRHYMSPLMYACQLGHVKIVEMLLSSNAEMNYQDNRGWTALCYAASTGSVDLVNMLIDRGSNPNLFTHLGDTPSSLALASGYTQLADSLDGRNTANTPSYNKKDGNEDKIARTDQIVSSEGGRQFGDLELFLSGLKLRHLEPILQSHCIDFSHLLMLTDKDLDDMGITQVGVKRTLLDAIADLHKARWTMPDKPFDTKRGLSLQEYSAVLCQLATHVDYINSSTTFLLNHTAKSSGPSPVTMAISEQEQKELTNQIVSVVKASNQLTASIATLETEVYKEMGSKPPTSKGGVFRSVVKTFSLPVGFAMCGVALCYLCARKPPPLILRLFT